VRRVALALLALAVAGALYLAFWEPRRGTHAERVTFEAGRTVAQKPRVMSKEPKAEPKQAALPSPPRDFARPGPCSLFLVLTNDETGKPFASRVELYRLGLPADEHFTAGDRYEKWAKVKREGTWIRDLPVARYRIVVSEQRFESEDPQPFGVEGAETRVSLPVPRPREYEAHLVILDESGVRVSGGGVRGGGTRYHSRDTRPSWLVERELRHPERYRDKAYGRTGHASSLGARYSTDEQTAEGFRMRPWRQSTKWSHSSTSYKWRKEGWTPVLLGVSHDGEGDRRYVGATRRVGPILDSIRLPDGGRAVDAGAKVHLYTLAVEEARDAWRRCFTTVSVALEGYAPLLFELPIGEQPEVRTLEEKTGRE